MERAVLRVNNEYIIQQLHEIMISLERCKSYTFDRTMILAERNAINESYDMVARIHSQLAYKSGKREKEIDREFDTPLAYCSTEPGSPGYITRHEAELIRTFRSLDMEHKFDAIADLMNLKDSMKYSKAAKADHKIIDITDRKKG